jgi:hypothetical protein
MRKKADCDDVLFTLAEETDSQFLGPMPFDFFMDKYLRPVQNAKPKAPKAMKQSFERIVQRKHDDQRYPIIVSALLTTRSATHASSSDQLHSKLCAQPRIRHDG